MLFLDEIRSESRDSPVFDQNYQEKSSSKHCNSSPKIIKGSPKGNKSLSKLGSHTKQREKSPRKDLNSPSQECQRNKRSIQQKNRRRKICITHRYHTPL